MPKIDRIFAFIAENSPDNEGIPAFEVGDGIWTPLIGGDQARINSLRGSAQIIANATGKKLTLAIFSVRTDQEVIEPKGETRE